MKEHVQRRTCDRCGAVTFEPYKDTTNCGFYYRHNFTETEGWTWAQEYGDLCSECNKALLQTHQKFMQGFAL